MFYLIIFFMFYLFMFYLIMLTGVEMSKSVSSPIHDFFTFYDNFDGFAPNLQMGAERSHKTFAGEVT